MKSEFHPFKLAWPDAFSLLVLCVALWCIPIEQLDHLRFIPGDIGDSRLNNYFLENIFQFLNGNSESLWHLPFFAPFPYIGGFSDNHFGTAPVYLFFRYLGMGPIDAFQYWFLFGYVANYAASYYVMRRLGGSVIAASFAALIFAFALPTTAHANHVQLHYRFAIPLVTYFALHFSLTHSPRSFLISLFWLMWQFYVGIYMGFFALLLYIGIFLAALPLCNTEKKSLCIFYNLKDIFKTFALTLNRSGVTYISGMMFIMLGFVVLFYPYLMVKLAYGFSRGWQETSEMLPRLQSYLIADSSLWWRGLSGPAFDLPMRHEHQMFPGLMASVTAIAGVLIWAIKSRTRVGAALLGAAVGIVLITLSLSGLSFWYLLHRLPLFSAIRALTRIDQVLLVPLAFFSMITIDYLLQRKNIWRLFLIVAFLIVMTVEFASVRMPKSEKAEWIARFDAANHRIPQIPTTAQAVFVAKPPSEPWFAHEIDVMWVSLMRGVKTFNGYSGFVPPGYSLDYGSDCAEFQRRLQGYKDFETRNQARNAGFESDEVFLFGFTNCQK